LEQYAESFERNDVGLELLPDLSDADLEKRGLTLGHRKRLLKGVAELQFTAPIRAAETDPSIVRSVLEAERRQLTILFCDLIWLHAALTAT
jgi:SAM (Sterile alpha motif) domain-containing protein